MITKQTLFEDLPRRTPFPKDLKRIIFITRILNNTNNTKRLLSLLIIIIIIIIISFIASRIRSHKSNIQTTQDNIRISKKISLPSPQKNITKKHKLELLYMNSRVSPYKNRWHFLKGAVSFIPHSKIISGIGIICV